MARKRGVICGHFDIAGLHDDRSLIFANCGNWLDSMTALAEASDGTLRLLAWRTQAARLAQPSHGQEHAA